MTYIVNESCIKCKLMDCVEVCPVDCFYEGENMLVIHPDECIDCGVCEPECPVDAIKPDTEPGLEKWLSLNKEFASKWPNITLKGEPPARWSHWETDSSLGCGPIEFALFWVGFEQASRELGYGFADMLPELRRVMTEGSARA